MTLPLTVMVVPPIADSRSRMAVERKTAIGEDAETSPSSGSLARTLTEPMDHWP